MSTPPLHTASSPLNFRLELYEGPLDLLLDLIRKQQIDIRDIPIASITAQYLEYMERARELDVDLGAEFVYMAATLIHIKSRMLLPRDPELDKQAAEEDPRRELVERLLEHEKFRNAAQMLQQKRMIEENVWSNPQAVAPDEEPALAVTLFDLVKVFSELVERARNRPLLDVPGGDVSVAGMVQYLRRILQAGTEDEPVRIVRLLESQPSLRAMIALFLAVLELVKLQAVTITQKDLFGEIALRRHKAFDKVFASNGPAPAVDEDYT
ncbi:MAG: chromosome segregation protein ScpA [Acidobacteria bacterium]|nr:chromosome segregation protein ScpA [Acidobacteriota bacterium]